MYSHPESNEDDHNHASWTPLPPSEVFTFLLGGWGQTKTEYIMATPLSKEVHRVVEIDGDKYLASLEPAKFLKDLPKFALRKMRSSTVHRMNIESLIKDPLPAPEPVPTSAKEVSRPTAERLREPAFTAGDIKDILMKRKLDRRLRDEVLKAVDTLLKEDQAGEVIEEGAE